jgi:hypothetical protein
MHDDDVEDGDMTVAIDAEHHDDRVITADNDDDDEDCDRTRVYNGNDADMGKLDESSGDDESSMSSDRTARQSVDECSFHTAESQPMMVAASPGVDDVQPPAAAVERVASPVVRTAQSPAVAEIAASTVSTVTGPVGTVCDECRPLAPANANMCPHGLVDEEAAIYRDLCDVAAGLVDRRAALDLYLDAIETICDADPAVHSIVRGIVTQLGLWDRVRDAAREK